MKLFIIFSAFLLAFSICVEEKTKSNDPIYEEVPLIVKNNSPLNLNFNPRIDMINADGQSKRAHFAARDRKISLRSKLARGFTLKALNDWLQHLGSQNLNKVDKGEYVKDLVHLKGFAKLLQSHIITNANSVMDNLTLMDLKLKEKKLIGQEIQQVKVHPGNINSNLGNNLAWKERQDEIVNNAASVHSEFDTALYGVCEVVKRINYFVKNMERTYTDARKVHKPSPKSQFYPNVPTVINRPRKQMNSDSVKRNLSNKTERQILIQDVKKSLLPELKKIINKEVKKELRKKRKGSPMSALKKMVKEESQIENVPSAAPQIKYIIKKTVRKFALKIASKTAKTIVNLTSVKKAKRALASTGNKVTKKVKKYIKKAQNATKKELKILKKTLVKKMKKESKLQSKRNTSGKASVTPLVEKSVAKAVKKLNTAKLSKKINNKINLPDFPQKGSKHVNQLTKVKKLVKTLK